MNSAEETRHREQFLRSEPMPGFEIIAHIHTDFPEKFGIPRQSGLVPELAGKIIFEEKYRREEALRGLEEFSHIWLIWQFSQTLREGWTPSVRPPKLGGNVRKGVFATRSPFRPNGIGLSCVKLDAIKLEKKIGPALYVSGIDMADGTPIYDIKPYLSYADSHPEACCGFSDSGKSSCLKVEIPPHCAENFPAEKLSALRNLLAQDPRPAYQADTSRNYGFSFAGHEIKFRVANGILEVISIYSTD